MSDSQPHFLLVGNGPYLNRGCEAILRGTMVILRHAFGTGIRVTSASFATRESVLSQARQETDSAIRYICLDVKRFTVPWLMRQLNKRLRMNTPGDYWRLRRVVREAAVALELGGDNYSLDYGAPRYLIETDRFLVRSGVPVVVWGASVGPFDADPSFAREMFGHLRTLEGIFVRESASAEYLRAHGIGENVRETADPAFVMEPTEPPRDKLPCPMAENPIGLNLSPHMSVYVTGGDLDLWRALCADAVTRILRETGRGVLLVPHVFQLTPSPYNDDPGFLRSLSAAVHQQTGRVLPILSAQLSASELKWMIARCAVFAGCRTHSTIAALSSHVPTLSLAYSTKARGINRDMYGSQEYCLEPADVTPSRLCERVTHLLDNAPGIRSSLGAAAPAVSARALAAGTYLRETIHARSRSHAGA